MAVWATFVRRTSEEPWRLEAMSVLSAERARALAERDHARTHVVGAQYLVRQYETPHAVPWTLDAPDDERTMETREQGGSALRQS
jgi:hypothetical protein